VHRLKSNLAGRSTLKLRYDLPNLTPISAYLQISGHKNPEIAVDILEIHRVYVQLYSPYSFKICEIRFKVKNL